jgi:putative ABC transport system permease protein
MVMRPGRGPLGLIVRVLLHLFPEDVPGITRAEMAETFFDRLAGVGGARRPAVTLGALWDLARAGVGERVQGWGPASLVRGLGEDLRFAARSLARSPVFALGAAVMLALGIGATNAMYSMNAMMAGVVDRFREPDDLVFLWGTEPGRRRVAVSARELEVWRREAGAFEEIGAYQSAVGYLSGGEEPLRTFEVRVSPNLLPMLGLEAELGRLPVDADAESSAEPVAVLTWPMWHERFGGDPHIVGRTLELDDVTHTVVGVLPEEVRFENLWRGAGVFTPLALRQAGSSDSYEDRMYSVMARLGEGVTLAQARAQMEVLATRLAQDDPGARSHLGVTMEPFRDYFYSRDDRLAVGSMILAVLAVLLIACVNMANLLLARGTARQGEVAIRMAVGASRWQIVRRLLVESFALALLGGAAGVVLGMWGIRLLLSSFPTTPFMAEQVSLDIPYVAFTLAVSTGAALAFGLAPALLASRVSLGAGLKESGAAASSARARKRFRSGILVTQIALTVPLVVTCVVAFRHVRALETVDFGIDTDALITARVDLPPHRYPDGAQQSEFYRRLQEAVGGIPGVEVVGAGVDLPIGAGSRTQYGPLVMEGHETDQGIARGVGGFKVVSPNFFRALGVPMVAGRGLSPDDGPADPRVAVVNEALVRRYWPDADPLGRLLFPDTTGSRYADPGWSAGAPITVVGVVRDFGATFYGEPPTPTVYLPHAQAPVPSMLLVATASQDPGALLPALRQTIRRVDPDVPSSLYSTGGGLVDTWLQESRTVAATLGLLGALALGLAVLGLYGMVAYSVARRRFELGVRMVLGADRRSVRFAVMRSFLVLGGLGILGGLAISAATALAVRSQLVMLRTSVASTAGFIAALLVTVVLVASYLPARRATAIEPVRALRCE